LFINTELEGIWKEMVGALIQEWTIPGRQDALATKFYVDAKYFSFLVWNLLCVTLLGKGETWWWRGKGGKCFPPYFLHLRIVFYYRAEEG
jgi:hypothetical protein